jgi:hypothetical protein
MNNPQPWWHTSPPEEVAAAILPLFSQSAYQEDREARVSIVNWFKTGSYKSRIGIFDPLKDPDHRAVTEAIQVLEHARLLVRIFPRSETVHVGLTRLGIHALQTNTVRQHLGLGDVPPTS